MKKLITIKDGILQVEKVLKTDYKTLLNLLENVDTLTCATRKIGDHHYDIWLDDEGLLKNDELTCSAIAIDNSNEALVGNLVIANYDMEGNTIGLEDEDIKEIIDNFIVAKHKENVLTYDTSCGIKKLILKEDAGFLCYCIN